MLYIALESLPHWPSAQTQSRVPKFPSATQPSGHGLPSARITCFPRPEHTSPARQRCRSDIARQIRAGLELVDDRPQMLRRLKTRPRRQQ
jgi:hypothetical protein